METDLIKSLDVAQKILEFKRTELKILAVILQGDQALSDELITWLTQSYDVVRLKEIEELKKIIASLEEQKRIFGSKGLNKELNIVSKEEYPDLQQPENI